MFAAAQAAMNLGFGALSIGTQFMGQMQQYGVNVATVDEKQRRAHNQAAQLEGTATSRAASSGVAFGSSSTQQFLKSLHEESQKQLNFMQTMDRIQLSEEKKAIDTQLYTNFAKLFLTFGAGGMGGGGGGGGMMGGMFGGGG